MQIEFAKGDIEKLQDKILRKVSSELLAKANENMIQNGTPDMGFLLNSGILRKVSNTEYEVVYTAPYASCIEFGTSPHPVAAKHLLRWVRRKLSVRGKKEQVSAAYAIAKKIEQEGTDAQPFLRPAIKWVVGKYGLR